MYKIGVDVGGPPPRSTSLSSIVADILDQGRTRMLSFLMSRLNLLQVEASLPSTRRQLLQMSLQRSLQP